MNLAVQLYTLREFLQSREDFPTTLHRVGQIGYRSIELAGIGPLTVSEFKALSDREQLYICSTHNDYSDFKERLDDLIAEHHLLGSKFVGLGGGIPTAYRNKDGYTVFGKELSEIGKILRSEGLSFVYHNHDFEFARYDGITGMDLLLESSDPESFFFELDLYWVQKAGANPAAWIRKLGNRVKIVHLKDMIVTHDKEQRFAEVGEGNMDYSDILDVCERVGVEWGIVEQDQCFDQDPFECITASYRNLQVLMGGK